MLEGGANTGHLRLLRTFFEVRVWPRLMRLIAIFVRWRAHACIHRSYENVTGLLNILVGYHAFLGLVTEADAGSLEGHCRPYLLDWPALMTRRGQTQAALFGVLQSEAAFKLILAYSGPCVKLFSGPRGPARFRAPVKNSHGVSERLDLSDESRLRAGAIFAH